MNMLRAHSWRKVSTLKFQFLTATILAMATILNVIITATNAQEYQHGKLKIDHPWARVTIPGRPAAGYMIVHNQGDADKIISASSPAANRIEMHTTTMKDGVMRMRATKHVDVPAKGSVEFKSGGFHLMIFGLKPSVKQGSKLPLTVVFDKAGPVKMELVVKKSAKAMDHSGHGNMDKKGMKH